MSGNMSATSDIIRAKHETSLCASPHFDASHQKK